ncbi:MAG: helical backbone metal receptor [Polyangiaceae bacterium]
MVHLFDDDRGKTHRFDGPPTRIVSLVPSDTLTVAELGAGATLVGRTDYCELPEDTVRGIPSVGGTKNPSVDAIVALAPDLVLANQEENTKADVLALDAKGIRVFVAFPKRVAEGIGHLARLCRILDRGSDPAAKALVRAGYAALRDAESRRASAPTLRVFCPIWMDPLMTIHGETFISDMLDLAGAVNVFHGRERRYPLAADLGKGNALRPEKVMGRDVRYPRVTLEEVVAAAPELVLLPDEPHPFSDADADVFRALPIPAAKSGAVLKISGKDLCWYGSRSVEGIARVRAIVDAVRPTS